MNDKIVGRPIRLNKQVLQVRRRNFAECVFIGDVHWGSPQCDKDRFLRMLDYCKNHNIYVFLMGDLIEVATRDSVGAGVYEQESIAQSQYEQMVEWLSPLAKKNLILGTHQGNHEFRVYKSTGVNIAKAMARELKVPYLGDACWSLFTIVQNGKRENYSLYTLHGATGAIYEGTVLTNAERIASSFYCDLLVVGHSHKAINSSVVVQSVKDGSIHEQKKVLVISGSYLKYDGSYGQTAGRSISKLGSPKVKFAVDRHDITVSW